MGPSELLSVRLFKQHIAGHLPEYSAVDDANVLQTLQRSLSPNLYDSAEFLKIQLKNNQVDFAQVIEEFVSDLADHYVQSPHSSDPVIEQLLKNNYFSFTSKVEAAKDLQLAIQRSERKRLKEILRANDEEQEAEDLKIVFERLERMALKKRLLEEEEFKPTANDSFFSRLGSSNKRAYYGRSQNSKSLKGYSSSSKFGMWVRVAAILLVILIPAGILLYRNMFNQTVPVVAETGKKPDSSDDTQYLASEDISGLLDIRLPDVSIKQVISKIDSDLDRGQGYASEDVTKIKIEVISKASQFKYLKLKADSIYRKYADFENQLKQGNVKKYDPEELRKQIKQLKIARKRCDQLADQMEKSDMLYEFTLTNLKLYLNKDIDPKRFTVREEINPDTREMEYFLLLDDKVYRKLLLSKGAKQKDSIQAIQMPRF